VAFSVPHVFNAPVWPVLSDLVSVLCATFTSLGYFLKLNPIISNTE